ncbi:MAG: histidine kinase, partial [Bacilli bacterium]
MFSSSRFKTIVWQFIQTHMFVGLLSILTMLLIPIVMSVLTYGLFPSFRLEMIQTLAKLKEDWSPLIFFFIMSLFISLLIILLMGVVFGFISSKKVKDRLQLLSRAATTFSQGNLRYRLLVEGEDEISDLTSGWNAMAERVEEQVNALQRLSEENASLAEQSAQGAAFEERQRLARELHDSISQQLFAMNITAAAVVKLIEGADVPYKLKQQIGYLEEMAASIHTEMRTLIFHLRPIQLEGQTLVQGVRNLLRELEERHDLPSDF